MVAAAAVAVAAGGKMKQRAFKPGGGIGGGMDGGGVGEKSSSSSSSFVSEDAGADDFAQELTLITSTIDSPQPRRWFSAPLGSAGFPSCATPRSS